MAANLAAKSKQGLAMPDGSHGDLDGGPAGVLLLSAEDGLSTTAIRYGSMQQGAY